MKIVKSAYRREFLGKLGRGLLALLGGGALAGTTTRGAGAGVFAGQFLKEREPVQLPAGFYDKESQLFRVTKTGEAMFVDETGPAARLTQEELAKLLENGTFVDVSRFPKMKVAAATRCTQTTLKTTRCCPIITDQGDDNIDDD